MKKIWSNEPIIVITLDTDWASEYTLKYTYSLLEKHCIKSTFFLTNHSVFLLDLIKKGYIDAGIHPNFLQDSSQGNSYKEVIDYCLDILPNSISYRSHRYFDVNDITEMLANKGFKYDSNLCTYLAKVEPFKHRSGLIRFPIYFEDGAYLYHNGNMDFHKIKEELFYNPGLMVINIHPMHLMLNSPSFDYMKKIKGNLSRIQWSNIDIKDLLYLSYQGYGIRDFILELFKFINTENIKVFNLYELYKLIS